jgi:hypothetical protein
MSSGMHVLEQWPHLHPLTLWYLLVCNGITEMITVKTAEYQVTMALLGFYINCWFISATLTTTNGEKYLKQKQFLTGDIPLNDRPSDKYFNAEPNQFWLEIPFII